MVGNRKAYKHLPDPRSKLPMEQVVPILFDVFQITPSFWEEVMSLYPVYGPTLAGRHQNSIGVVGNN
jgi:hypothetical protein